MTFEFGLLDKYFRYDHPKRVAMGNDGILFAQGEGVVYLPVFQSNSDEISLLVLSNILYVPKLKKNLVSVTKMTLKNAEVCFDNEKCMLFQAGKSLTLGHLMHKTSLYRIDAKQEYACVISDMSQSLWHNRLGHLNSDYMKKLVTKDMSTGLQYKDVKDSKCEPCILGKMPRQSVPKNQLPDQQNY